jgi:hypothetical protein
MTTNRSMAKPPLIQWPSSLPIAQGGGKADGGEEGVGEAVVAGGDAAEVLEAAEHALDALR